MLKLILNTLTVLVDDSAAFGRLCVETGLTLCHLPSTPQPPSGGCVLKLKLNMNSLTIFYSAAFGRLCVETTHGSIRNTVLAFSRLRAAVC